MLFRSTAGKKSVHLSKHRLANDEFIDLVGFGSRIDVLKAFGIQHLADEIGIGENGFKILGIPVVGQHTVDPPLPHAFQDEEFPNINEGDLIAVEDIISEEKETKPPARYNEASLIKELEKRELGTKATRADIIAKLYDRKYISGSKIEVNQLGENMIDTLSEYCNDITSEELTRGFENKLEGIDQDKDTKENVISEGKVEVKVILGDIEKNAVDRKSVV